MVSFTSLQSHEANVRWDPWCLTIYFTYQLFVFVNSNAIAHEGYVFENIPEELQPFHSGQNFHTKEPLGAMSRSDDPQFSDFLRWITYAIIYAEEEGITKETSERMPTTNLFGEDLTNIFRDSIKAVGNYEEVFERNLGGLLPRTTVNTINRSNGPHMYALLGTI